MWEQAPSFSVQWVWSVNGWVRMTWTNIETFRQVNWRLSSKGTFQHLPPFTAVLRQTMLSKCNFAFGRFRDYQHHTQCRHGDLTVAQQTSTYIKVLWNEHVLCFLKINLYNILHTREAFFFELCSKKVSNAQNMLEGTTRYNLHTFLKTEYESETNNIPTKC